ncbi:MAG: MotA/TolQ/ExbB proton channel family protein [Thermodesulfovibrionales bacterium]
MNILLGGVVVVGVISVASVILRGIDISMIFDPDALLIVIGGTIIALFVGFPFKRVRDTVCDIVNAFRDKRDREAVVRDIVDIARIYRRANIKDLENRLKEKKGDDFLMLGINLLINHHRSTDIRNIMEREMSFRVVNYNFSQNMLKTIARLTPSLGLAGTVISLIKMFKNLQSVDAMATLIAAALMSTFYGVIISNLFILPLYAKLKEKAVISETLMNITIEGIVAINELDHPFKIEEKIKGYDTVKDIYLSRVGAPLTINKGTSGV